MLYWISHGNSLPEDALYIFKKTFTGNKGGKFTARISADTRYKLYVNGVLASVGPCKGTDFTAYYETVELSPYLIGGENEITAKVLYLGGRVTGVPASLMSVTRKSCPAFMFDGELTVGGKTRKIVSDSTWQVCVDKGVSIEKPVFSSFAALNEKASFYEKQFIPAVEIEACNIDNNCHNPYGELDTYMLKERTIPPLYIGGDEELTDGAKIPANSKQTLILDAGKLVTSYFFC